MIECVTGNSYYDVVAESVYTPAAMHDTGSEPEEVHVPNRAVGYTAGFGAAGPSTELRPNTDYLPYRGTGAGGGYSTVGDLVKFADALVSCTLLDAAHTSLLTSGKADVEPPDHRYAYGFGEHTGEGGHYFGHNGGAPGMSGDIRIYPERGYVVAALANFDPPIAGDLVHQASACLPQQH